MPTDIILLSGTQGYMTVNNFKANSIASSEAEFVLPICSSVLAYGTVYWLLFTDVIQTRLRQYLVRTPYRTCSMHATVQCGL